MRRPPTLPSVSSQRSFTLQLIGLSANDVSSHHGWIKDIDALTNSSPLDFPIIADKDRKISTLYGMLDKQDKTNVDAKG